MAFTPDSPSEGKVPAPPETRLLNKLHVLRLDIQLTPDKPEATKVGVTWSEGYQAGEEYKSITRQGVLLEGEDLIAKMNSVPSGGSLFGEVKAAIWDLLKTRGLVGPGSVG